MTSVCSETVGNVPLVTDIGEALAVPRQYRNQLFAADNLAVLQEKIASESIELVYLDPPFNSKQAYNVIFTERHGKKSTSQKLVFEDTWTWNPHTEEMCRSLEEGGDRLSDVIRSLRTFLGNSDMMAYLVMMAPRLRELHRVLKPTGSLYLHCDPTASHYLKLLLDAVFKPQNYRNEIIWKRTASHNSAGRFGPVHGTIHYYSKGEKPTWVPHYQPYSGTYKKKFNKVDPASGLSFQDQNLTGPGLRMGDSGQAWRGNDVSAKGRHWQLASYLYEKYQKITGEELKKYPLLKRLDKLDDAGLIYWPEKKGGFPRYKQFLEDSAGLPLSDVWIGIDPVNSQAQERLGYPTQKPYALLERIIRASSKPDDVILDPFCGCGTAIEAAETLGRRWIGIDVTLLAAAVIKTRLVKFGEGIFKHIKITGEPITLEEAEALAEADKFGFQWWAVGKLGAPPIEEKKGRDRGVDGRIFFHDDAGPAKHIVISVKAGQVGPAAVRELRGVVERDHAAMGILVTVRQRTAEMLREAAVGGMYKSINGIYPRLQIITVEDMFADKPLSLPGKKINPYEPKRVASVSQPAEQLRLLP